MIGVGLDVPAARWTFLIACLALALLAVAVNRLVWFTTSAADRLELREASNRPLPPLAPVDGALEIDLEPGWSARDTTNRQIVLDADGLHVPVWTINMAPRSLEKRGQPVVSVRWADIDRWRVRSDTDGPDLYEITTRNPWFATHKPRWPNLRIERRVITDEIALLDGIRSIGQISIELETSLSQLAEV